MFGPLHKYFASSQSKQNSVPLPWTQTLDDELHRETVGWKRGRFEGVGDSVCWINTEQQYNQVETRKSWVVLRRGRIFGAVFVALILVEPWKVKVFYYFFFLYSCQPTGYISVGGSRIVTQSNESATLQMITTREILPQFTMIGHNRYQSSLGLFLKGLFSRYMCSKSCSNVLRLWSSRKVAVIQLFLRGSSESEAINRSSTDELILDEANWVPAQKTKKGISCKGHPFGVP